ncbi:GyrI-like domain-containing protein [Anaerolineales bacterium]
MKISERKVERHDEQNYVGIRTKMKISEMGSGIIPQLLDEVWVWLEKQGEQASGASLMRYYVINMEGQLDVELGWFVDKPLKGEGRIQARTLPAGRYASLIYTGAGNGVKANGALIEWAKQQSMEWDRWDDEAGDAFRARYEVYLTEPDDEPDPAKWETEVCIKLAD